MLEPYIVIAQAGPDEILLASSQNDLNIKILKEWESVKDVIVVLPELDGVEEAKLKLQQWGIKSISGDAYNVCNRVLSAYSSQQYTVRVLAVWKHIDLSYVDQMVKEMQIRSCDLVSAPRDFDATMAADVASISAIKKVANLSGDEPEIKRAKFNPWGYIETHPEQFDVFYAEPAPSYSDEIVSRILTEQRCHPENEFFGRDYAGSRYHHIVDQIPDGLRILDIACGSGSGAELLSRKAEFVLGVDYLDEYIDQAKSRFPENNKLKFEKGDAQSFLYHKGSEYFDLITSFHTLEHVPDDNAMINCLYRNLRPGGLLISEVPLLAKRPLGVPINPFHLREYVPTQFIDLIKDAGFSIQKTIGASRGFYVAETLARDALQIWAIKKGA